MRSAYSLEERVARFWRKVDKDGPAHPALGTTCWLWMGGTGLPTSPYGKASWIGRRLFQAHRLSWEIVNGPPAHSLLVLHRCDVPLCVRPEHLFLGTHVDNERDKYSKDRGIAGDRNWTRQHPERLRRGGAHHAVARPEVMARGMGHGGAKLTDAQVLEIRARHVGGASCRSMALDYPVGVSMIESICRGTSWKHLL